MSNRQRVIRGIIAALLTAVALIFVSGSTAQAAPTPSQSTSVFTPTASVGSMFREVTTWSAMVNGEPVEFNTFCKGFYFGIAEDGNHAYGATDPSCVDDDYFRRQANITDDRIPVDYAKVKAVHVTIPSGGLTTRSVQATVSSNGDALNGAASTLIIPVAKSYIKPLRLATSVPSNLRGTPVGIPFLQYETVPSTGLPLVTGTATSASQDENGREVESLTDIRARESFIGSPIVNTNGEVIGVVNSHTKGNTVNFTKVDALRTMAIANGMLVNEKPKAEQTFFHLLIFSFWGNVALVAFVIVVIFVTLMLINALLTARREEREQMRLDDKEHELKMEKLKTEGRIAVIKAKAALPPKTVRHLHTTNSSVNVNGLDGLTHLDANVHVQGLDRLTHSKSDNQVAATRN